MLQLSLHATATEAWAPQGRPSTAGKKKKKKNQKDLNSDPNNPPLAYNLDKLLKISDSLFALWQNEDNNTRLVSAFEELS